MFERLQYTYSVSRVLNFGRWRSEQHPPLRRFILGAMIQHPLVVVTVAHFGGLSWRSMFLDLSLVALTPCQSISDYLLHPLAHRTIRQVLCPRPPELRMLLWIQLDRTRIRDGDCSIVLDRCFVYDTSQTLL